MLKTSVAVAAALLILSANLSEATVRVRHHHHSHSGFGNGLAPGVAPNAPIPDQPEYGGAYGGGGIYSHESGGINSQSNDFGTSGALGHTNGMPANTYFH
jgi:hypothetical protein